MSSKFQANGAYTSCNRTSQREPQEGWPELTFNAVLLQVLLTSFEMVMRDENELAKETWQFIVVDEAHKYLKCL
jgi:SNF2 family DNA or RNA helicase